MSIKINDSVFGEMTYVCSWERQEDVCIWGRDVEMRIVAEAYSGEDILECQRLAYKEYLHKYSEYLINTPVVLLNYYLKNYDYISSNVEVPDRINRENINKELIVKLVKIRTLYIDRKGQFGWLCDCAWDNEHGICILLSGDGIRVEEYDYLL